ncbi:hypothetical protein A2311_01805 [candidate division WOR-1 bacterium RIFOXYB2_FULL_48_7]|uniref:KilA-N DNA-binding domain-containing protein n=1 Tax=candidate division WOR-1 bacterium RIFOXYB2_FULL_48_7 TaxID=1802583 RepID=A0A1F4TDA0_UNCSA|nr:MAG: hypothetical protein A2311_01805 [candidate division WOR-1 bacterium RIFOXYB2_FULL_48_7]
MKALLPTEFSASKIYYIREQKVMLDKDLAELYGVMTSQLKRQVKRNAERFPKEFMFILNQAEIAQLVCHFGIPSKSLFGGAAPFVFTEQGVAMLSSVLKSQRAVQVNIAIMKTFVKLRELIASHKDIIRKIEEMESKYDQQFKIVFDAIKALIAHPEPERKEIGFRGGRQS